MGNFEDRVTALVRTVVDPEIRTVWDALLDRPEDNKAALDDILQKINAIGDWMPRIKSEVKDIQDTLRAQQKKEDSKKQSNDKRERLEKKKEKVKELLKEYADRLADDLLPDAVQKWLQPLTGDQYMRDYGDDGVDIIENMIDNTITNLPLLLAIRTGMNTLRDYEIVTNGLIKQGMANLDSKIRDIENNYLDSMNEILERVEMVQNADHDNIIRIDRAIDSLSDQLSRCCNDMSDQLGSIADTLSQCCQNMSQAMGNIAQTLDSMDTHLSNSTQSIMDKIDSLDISNSQILTSIANSGMSRRFP